VVRVAVNLGKGWTNMPLADRLDQRLGLPACVDNDVRVGALVVGTGIGGGLILDGKVRTGFRGGAGEVGHSVVNGDDGVLDAHGQPGAVEPIASRTGMQRQVLERVAQGRTSLVPELMESLGGGRLTSRVIYEAVRQKDPVMLEVLAVAQHALGVLAGNLVNILDPEMIVIGGGVTERMGDRFVAPIRRVAQAHYINKTDLYKVKIVPAALKDLSGVVGAAVLARERL
jgi:glucokinase